MNRLIVSMLLVLAMLVHFSSVLAQENDWPRTVPLKEGLVTIYALQVDGMSDDNVQFRAALAYRETPEAEPVFGAGWFESRVEIDTNSRIVHPTDLKVTETRFPVGSDDLQSDLAAVLARQSRGWNLDFSLDQLEDGLKTAAAESKAAEGMNTAPPRIIYRDQPALLISLDGEPVLREIENSPYQAVINTPYPLIFDGKRYYLNAAKNVWYRAKTPTGPYQLETKPPKDIAAMVDASDIEPADEEQFGPVTKANAPEIIVSTVPTELLVTEGPAAFVPLVDDLLVLQNSDDDVFMHVGSQRFFIVLAGRWYQAGSLYGPWTYQPADELPVAFANIPRESDQADSRVYVAGTEEARDAVMDAQVPQTAAVARGVVDIEVKYDGEPIYQPVDGTGLVYIENTGSTVLQSQGLYYLVEKGVWYVAPSPNGPWQVSDHRPEQVETILPTSPVYNVKYVRVYHSTPSLVYVGYTPGYVGSYVYHNTVFYGSGWHYRPWVSPYYYYPRYSTWGFHASYNPWSGWNYGLSWGWGPFSFSYFSGGYWHHGHHWHHPYYGGWGPRGYRPRPGHHGRGHKRYAHQSNKRGDHRQRNNGNYGKSGNRSNLNDRNDNLYRDDSQRARVAYASKRPSRATGVSDNYTRKVKNSGANYNRQKDRDRSKNGERNRIEPVYASDMRAKASIRDVNDEARRERWFADNKGSVYRGVDRSRELREVNNRKDRVDKTARRETVTRQRDYRQDLSQDSGQNRNRANKSSSRDNDSRRTTRPLTVASRQQSPNRSSEGTDRSSSSRFVNTRARSTPEPSKQVSGSRSSREGSSSARMQESTRGYAQQRSSNTSSRKQSASVPGSQRKAAQQSASHKSESKGGSRRDGGSKRDGGRRYVGRD